MATETKEKIIRLTELQRELHVLNKRRKEIIEEKKEIEEAILQFLKEEDKPGVRFGDMIFVADDKQRYTRKKKAEIEKDSAEILREHGVQNPTDVLTALAAAKKGEAENVSKLRIKRPGIFE